MTAMTTRIVLIEGEYRVEIDNIELAGDDIPFGDDVNEFLVADYTR